jgi:PAS domain S-box-containing protein
MADSPSFAGPALSSGRSDASGTGSGLARQSLREAEDRLQALSDLTHTYTYSLRCSAGDGVNVEWVSEALLRVFGIAPGTACPKTWERIVPPEDQDRVREWFARALEGDTASCEHRVLDRDGTLRWVEHSVRVRPREGDWIPLHGAAQDITERRRTQEKLADSEARFRALAENATHLIAEIDASGRLVYLNPAVREILGYPPVEGVGGGRFESLVRHRFVHPDDADIQELRRTFATTEPRVGRMRMRRADGEWRWIEFASRSFRTARGDWHRVSIGRDVTEELALAEQLTRHAQTLEEQVERRTAALQAANQELRSLQQRMLYAERLGVAEELAGSVAHAINNPLAALLGTVEMEIEATPGGNPRLLRIRRLAQRIQAVISQTLALFREGTLRLAEEEPARIIEEMLSEIEGRAALHGVRIHSKTAKDLPRFLVDRTLLAAALVSLAENAIEAMPDGGDLWIDVSALPQIGVVRFAISDSGPGIPPELHKKIFEPFFTTKSSGTGLGLAIAQGVIRGHEGRIQIGTRSGGGALLSVDVPFRRPEDRMRSARTRTSRSAPRDDGNRSAPRA